MISAEQHITASTHLTHINPRGKYTEEQKSKESSLNLIIVFVTCGIFMHKIFYLWILLYHNQCLICILQRFTIHFSISNQMFSLKRYKNHHNFYFIGMQCTYIMTVNSWNHKASWKRKLQNCIAFVFYSYWPL